MMLQARALRIRALVHADRQEEARALAEAWSGRFPDDEDLAAAAGMTESDERP